jgi:hypothetical protein
MLVKSLNVISDRCNLRSRHSVGKRNFESLVIAFDLPSTWDSSPRMTRQPIACHSDCLSLILAVCADILSGNVRDELLKTVGFAIEDQAALERLHAVSKALSSQEHAKLQWHVEARKPTGFIQLCSRQIVNPKPTLLDNCKYLVDANLAAVIDLLCATDAKATVDGRKHNATEEPLVCTIKRAIDEYAELVIYSPTIFPFAGHRKNAPLS